MIDERTIDYPFPLEDGRLAYLYIPVPGRLSEREAERLTEMIKSLVDPEKAAQRGEDVSATERAEASA